MYEKSLKLYALTQYTKAFWLGSMISILFLKFIGLVDAEISLFHLITAILIFSLEIPTGGFADKYGYRLSIIISNFSLSFAFLSFVTAAFLGKWVILILAALFLSLSSSFSSGASSAYIFTIFKKRKESDKYLPYQSRIKRTSVIIEGLAIIIGAYLYGINELIPYSIQFVLVFGASLLSLKLEKDALPERKAKLPLAEHIKESFSTFTSKKIFTYFLIFLVFATMAHAYFHHIINQSIFVEGGMSVIEIGIIGLISNLVAGILVSFVPKIWNVLGEKYTYLVYSVLILIGPVLFIFGSSLIYFAIVTSIIYFANRSLTVILDNSMQIRIAEGHRATLISILNMISSIPIRIGLIIFSLTFIGLHYSEMIFIVGFIFGMLAIVFTSVFLIPKLKSDAKIIKK